MTKRGRNFKITNPNGYKFSQIFKAPPNVSEADFNRAFQESLTEIYPKYADQYPTVKDMLNNKKGEINSNSFISEALELTAKKLNIKLKPLKDMNAPLQNSRIEQRESESESEN